MTAMLSSTPKSTNLKGISVGSEIQIPPTRDHCSSDSHSDSSSLDWLREEEMYEPGNCNKKEGSPREREKKTATEENYDASKDPHVEMRAIDKTKATCKSLPSDDACPLDGLVEK